MTKSQHAHQFFRRHFAPALECIIRSMCPPRQRRERNSTMGSIWNRVLQVSQRAVYTSNALSAPVTNTVMSCVGFAEHTGLGRAPRGATHGEILVRVQPHPETRDRTRCALFPYLCGRGVSFGVRFGCGGGQHRTAPRRALCVGGRVSLCQKKKKIYHNLN